MERVTATASGVLVCGGQRAPDPVLSLLGRPLDLETGVTLASIAALFHTYPFLQDLSPFVPSFLKAFSQGDSPVQPAIPSAHTELELFRTVAMQGYPGTPRVHLFLTLKVRDGQGVQPLDLYPVESLRVMPLRLGKLRHTVFGDTLDTELFDTDYLLFDVLDSLMWELSFYLDKTQCGIRRS